MKTSIISTAARIIAAAILLQTLFFKFTGAEESVEIFTILGVEPYGRYAAGFLELMTAVLLICPRTCAHGALLGMAIMTGAIFSHITKLGWSGNMFSLGILAVVEFLLCLVVFILNRDKLKFKKSGSP